MHQFGRNIYLSHADWQIAPMWVSQSCWTEKQLMHLLLYSNFLLVNQKSLIEHPLCIAHCTRNYGVGGLPFLGANILGPPMKCWQLVYLVLSDHQHNFMILTLFMHRDVKGPTQGRTASKWKSWDLNLHLSDSRAACLISVLHHLQQHSI